MVDSPQPERANSSKDCSTSGVSGTQENRWRPISQTAVQHSAQIWDDILSRLLQRNRAMMGLAAGVHPSVAANDSLAGRDPISVVQPPPLRSLGASPQPLGSLPLPLRNSRPRETESDDRQTDGGQSDPIRDEGRLLGIAETVEDEVEAIELVNRKVGGRQLYLSTISQLMAGGIAGAVSKSCTAPLARLTILFQVQGMHGPAIKGQPSLSKEMMRIYREEGIRAFWKGNAVTIVHRLPYSALNFFSYEKYKAMLRNSLGIQDGQSPILSMGARLIAGGGAGVTAASLTYPLDLVRTRLAAQTKEKYYKGIGHALGTIAKDEGLRGLYKGMGATLLGVGPNIAINFCAYETMKNWIEVAQPQASPVAISLGCGSIAGICSSTFTFPIDLVRRRMQLEGARGAERVYKDGIPGMFRSIIKTEGWLGLYKGIIPEYYKVVPGVGIAFMTYEFLKRVFRTAIS